MFSNEDTLWEASNHKMAACSMVFDSAIASEFSNVQIIVISNSICKLIVCYLCLKLKLLWLFVNNEYESRIHAFPEKYSHEAKREEMQLAFSMGSATQVQMLVEVSQVYLQQRQP